MGFRWLIEVDMGSVRAGEFKDEVTQEEVGHLIALQRHIRARAVYCLADSKKSQGQADALSAIIRQTTDQMINALEQTKGHARE